MRLLLAAALYTAMGTFANAADIATLESLREGDMRKLRFHKTAEPVPTTPFISENGGKASMADYKGKVVVLNFWATWCAPCRKEMPMLSDLQTEFGGDYFDVVTVATGRNDEVSMKKFFDEIGVDNLPLHRDPRQAFAREMGVLGLPVTLLLDQNGDEIGRLQGDAHWNSDSAKAIIRAVIETEPE